MYSARALRTNWKHSLESVMVARAYRCRYSQGWSETVTSVQEFESSLGSIAKLYLKSAN